MERTAVAVGIVRIERFLLFIVSTANNHKIEIIRSGRRNRIEANVVLLYYTQESRVPTSRQRNGIDHFRGGTRSTHAAAAL